MTIAYLDPDDEITSAVARLRASEEVRVALVLPPGSRIATSRINFRLLAHEAREHQRRLAIVAGEPGVRAVAVSAGLPAYASVAEYEASLQTGKAAGAAEAAAAVAAVDGPPAAAAPPAVRRKGRRSLGADVATLPPAAAAASVAPDGPAVDASPPRAGGGRRGAPTDLPVVASRDRGRPEGRRGVWIAVSGVLLVGLVAAAGWVAFNVLPAATITVVPRTQVVGPINLTVMADPTATAIDVAGGVVPAQTVSVPVTATGPFNATGTKPLDTAATGTVTFTNNDTGGTHTIPQGTQVSTQSGVAFQTTKAVLVPRAIPPPSGFTPGRASVSVSAVVTGPAGNVAADTITRVSTAIQVALVNFSNPVNNAAPTTGGTHTLVQVVRQADYDAAVAALKVVLKTQLDAAGHDPTNVPAGVTLIPATATVGQAVADQPATAIVNKEEASFTLTLNGIGTIEGVDTSLVGQLAAARLASSVPSGYQLFTGSVQSTVGPAVVSGGSITFSASASGQMAARLDAAALVQQVLGKTVAQARAALEPLGTVTIETSPFYVGSVPGDPGRVTLTVAAPAAPSGTSTAAPSLGTPPATGTSSPTAPSTAAPTSSTP